MVSSDFRVISYDISPHFYADQTKRVGDAAREQLSPELMEHITFRHPTTAVDLKQYHTDNEIRFLFIDANHRHPWPTLDLLAALDPLSPGATVLLHDVNLPVRSPNFPDWGAKHLFDDLDVEKEVPQDEAIPNVGRIKIPEDKQAFKAQLLRVLAAHEWQANIKDDYIARLGISR